MITIYPRELSSPARARIEVERLKAKRDLEHAQSEEPPDGMIARCDRKAFYAYILRVFLAFVREACDLGADCTWTVDRIRSEVEEFLRRFTVEAYYENGRDRFGHRFARMTSDWNGSLLPEVERTFQASEEWHEFEAKLLAVAEQRSEQKSTLLAQGADSLTEDSLPCGDVDPTATERCALLTEFKSTAKAAGIRVTDQMVARAANPGKWNDRTMVTWWKRNDPKCKPPHDRKIRAVLAKDPASIWPVR